MPLAISDNNAMVTFPGFAGFYRRQRRRGSLAFKLLALPVLPVQLGSKFPRLSGIFTEHEVECGSGSVKSPGGV